MLVFVRVFFALLIVLMFLLGFQWIKAAPMEPLAFSTAPAVLPTDVNDDLKTIEIIDLNGGIGPEDVALAPDGNLYAAMLNGNILKISADHKSIESFINTGGRPLGLTFDSAGNLLVADPYKGLLRISPEREIETLVAARGEAKNDSDPATLCYANNVDVSLNGMIYFTDSTERYCPPEYSGTFEASLLDIAEHQRTGRFMSYNPATKSVKVLATGIQFANGVAVSPDGKYALIVETGDFRIYRYQLDETENAELEVLLEGLSGYPDNLTRGLNGRYWLGFTKPRSKIIESLSGKPRLRKALFTLLPADLRPVPPAYGDVMAIDIDGNIIERLQDPDPHYPDTTGVTETADYLYIHSLHAEGLGFLRP